MSKSRARRIRVGNLSYLGTHPYQLLRELDFVHYSEYGPLEAVRKLYEGELDVALIPASEFAAHGGLVGLDHGLACAERSDALLLCSRTPLQQLKTIYLYHGAAASAVLLRLLLREDWKICPRLVRVGTDFNPQQLGDGEGMLVLKDEIPPEVTAMPVVEDLVRGWDRLTGKPFVFLIWAVRPGVLSLKQHQALHEVFRRCVEASEEIIQSGLEEFDVTERAVLKFRGNNYSFYLDDNAIAGLNSFYHKAATQGMLPHTRYQSATFTLLNRRTIRVLKEPGVGEELRRVTEGSRLGIRDGVQIAERASLADLGLAADLMRNRVSPERTISQVCFIGGRLMRDTAMLDASIERAVERGAKQLLLLPQKNDLYDLEFFEHCIHHIRARFKVWLEGFTVPQLLILARNSGRPIQQVVSRLVTAGLDGVSGMGGGMLIDRALRRRGQRFGASEWLDVIRWVHRYGAKSTCCLTLSAEESWEERFIHLHRLRTIQDEDPGFRAFHLDYAPEWNGGAPSLELRMRAMMLSRLFLDNVASVQEIDFIPAEVAGVLSLSLGANEVRVDVAEGTGRWKETLRTLQALRELGMDFSEEPRGESDVGEVH